MAHGTFGVSSSPIASTAISGEYALLWQRTSPMIAALAGALQMTDAQIDDLFKAAAQISA